MTVTSATETQSTPVVAADQTGFAGLNSDTFLKLLITQLQNQDPLNPMSNDDLLNQISMMRNLQSNLEMTDALKSITTNQQLSTAATFIGRSITGAKADGTPVEGTVDRAFTRDGDTFVGIGNVEVPLSNVTSVVTK